MKNRRFLSLSLVGSVILLMGIYLYRNPTLFSALKNISSTTLMLLVVLRLFLMFTNGYTLKLIIAKFDINLSIIEWLGLPIITTLGNYITPFSGGMVARATYLKQRHTLPYAQFMSILNSLHIRTTSARYTIMASRI